MTGTRLTIAEIGLTTADHSEIVELSLHAGQNQFNYLHRVGATRGNAVSIRLGQRNTTNLADCYDLLGVRDINPNEFSGDYPGYAQGKMLTCGVFGVNSDQSGPFAHLMRSKMLDWPGGVYLAQPLAMDGTEYLLEVLGSCSGDHGEIDRTVAYTTASTYASLMCMRVAAREKARTAKN